jgi:hypothetical protein
MDFVLRNHNLQILIEMDRTEMLWVVLYDKNSGKGGSFSMIMK